MKSLLTWCVENNRQDIIKSYVLTNIYIIQDISYASKKLAYWYCDKCKTVYTQAIQNKTIQNQNCPICSHRRLAKGINDFETFCKKHSEFSHLLSEWDYKENTLKPDKIFPNYTKKIAWKCKNGHTWKTSPNNRIHNKNNCEKCAREENKEKIRVSRTKGKERSTVNPELAKYWDYDKNLERTPDNTTIGSNYVASWKCPNCNYSWKASVKYMGKKYKEKGIICSNCK